MKQDDIELLDDDLEDEKVQTIPTVSVEKDYLQTIPTVSTDIINKINEESNQPQLIDPETVSKSVGYDSSLKDKKKETEKKSEPKAISPDEVISQIGNKTPQMISPETVMQQVGSMRSQVSSQKIANVQKNANQITNIENSKDQQNGTYNSTIQVSTPVPTKIYLPPSLDDEDEFKEYKKLNKDYRITLLFIAVVILFTLGIITSIIDSNSVDKKTKEKKRDNNSSYIIENTTGNSYFYAPLNNKVKSGTSDETTYYLLGEENSGQTELFDRLTKRYMQNESNIINSQSDKFLEIESIKNKKSIFIAIPTEYNNLNERLIKASNKDGSIIVIKTSKGVTSKVEEHLRLMNQLGAEKTIIFINNDDETKDTEKLKKEVKKLIKDCGYDEKTPIIVGKSTANESVIELYEKIKDWINIVQSNSEKPLKAHIQHTDTESKGQQTIITIQIESGKIKTGDKIKLLGKKYSQDTIVNKIYINNEPAEKVTVKNENDNVTITINTKYSKSLDNADIVASETEDIHSKFNAIFYYSEDNNKRSRVFSNNYSTEIQLTRNIQSKITIPNEVNYIVKDNTTNITIEMSEKTPLFVGQQFVINDLKNNVFGYGEVTDIIE